MKNTMKVLAILVILATVIVIGCRVNASAEMVGLPNPMKEVTCEEMVETVGVPMPVPEDAENVRYFTITTKEAVIGQVDFTLNGKEYTFRTTTAEMDATQLSGIYFGNATESCAKVDYCEARFYTEALTSVLYWEDRVPGVCYSIACTDCEDPAVLLDIAKEVFIPLQGDSDGTGYAEFPTEYPDLEGFWQNENGDTVQLTAAGEHTYEAVVGICSLTEFTGTGKLDTISMDLTLEDPNGELLYAEFYQADDETCTLIISESIWNLLESGTEFTGFVRMDPNDASVG